ncbi:MAG: ABC transporter permease [Bacteroidetes bacterium]|nr:MAG: ABC transporter permease [Bacteroidota bacterium]
MNLEYFIARRVATSTSAQSFSRLIIRIAAIAIALSLTVMIVSTAVITGFKHQIQEKIFGFWGHIHITEGAGMRSLLEAHPIKIKQDFYPWMDTIRQVKYVAEVEAFGQSREIESYTHGGIRHIQVFALKPGIIRTKEAIEGIVLKGVDKDFDWTFFNKYLVAGEPVSFSDSTASSDIILSQQTVDRLNLQLGDAFRFYFVDNGEVIGRRFTVKGIFKTGLEEYDRKFALTDIRKIRQMLQWEDDEVGGFEVFIDDLRDLDVLTEYIYLEELPGDLYAENIRESRPAIFDWLELQNINEVVILILMLVVGIINMVTALMILILERTNMIGILKALGQTDWRIRKIFLYHAAYIVAVGLFWGNVIGLSLCWLQKSFEIITLSEENYYLSVAPVELNFWTILLLNVGTLVITVLFLIIPTWLVTRISPVRAIQFK